MTLHEMGVMLRHERERQGITLEHAATEIKISKKYLVALEEGNVKDLPHPVYAKGFVKNYARLLGLDVDAMADVLGAHYRVDEDGNREPPRIEVRDPAPGLRPRRTPSPSRSGSGSGFRPSLWLGLPLLAAFVGIAWFFFFSTYTQNFSLDSLMGLLRPSEDAAAPAKPEAKPAPKAEAKPEAKPEAKAEQAPAEQTPAPAVPRDLLATGSQKPLPGGSPDQQAQDISPARLAAEGQFAASGRQVVEINATQPARVEVVLEDGQSRTFNLVKGQRLSLRFNDKATVRFEQAPAVAVRLNGKDYPLEGGKADGRTIQFP
uniref:HTH cro/C1-type domain-containing protein n=1 Tax=Fundidesulfovibrio putealis TaxID=270496 RepID=A0A7C3WD59_9BACT